MNELQNNKVTISGTVISAPRYSHEIYKDRFYEFMIKCNRLSDNADILPITVNENMLADFSIAVGDRVEVVGQYRSYNKLDGAKNRLMLTIFASSINAPTSPMDRNEIDLVGYICKAPVYRTTPFRREICDILVAVNRGYNKSDYIPCIAWGRNAKLARELNVGAKVEISGRIQSREYSKRLDDGTMQSKIAYELSITSITSGASEGLSSDPCKSALPHAA